MNPDKIHVVGNPMRLSEVTSKEKIINRKKTIIFTHRFDKEKGVFEFLSLMQKLWEQRKDFKVIITTSRPTFRSNSEEAVQKLWCSDFRYQVKAGLTKDQYHGELGKAKIFVSTTLEENFGYCLTEAMANGCIPVVKNAFSHPELVDFNQDYLFETEEEALNLLNKFLDLEQQVILPNMQKFESVISNMLDIMVENNEQ
jgi:glycosyltransferase involved in cell wall biosynthesis